MTKAHHLHTHRRALPVRTKPLQQKTAQGVNRVFGSVDDLIGNGANTRHCLPLSTNRGQQSLTFFSRMGPPCFAETILKNVVGSFEEKDGDFQSQSAQLFEFLFEAGEKLTFTNVDDERRASDAFLVILIGNEAAECWQHRHRQVVDAEVTEVLKSVRG